MYVYIETSSIILRILTISSSPGRSTGDQRGNAGLVRQRLGAGALGAAGSRWEFLVLGRFRAEARASGKVRYVLWFIHGLSMVNLWLIYG